eukprot:11195239-Lingulodinium_polyedra.AAC.1
MAGIHSIGWQTTTACIERVFARARDLACERGNAPVFVWRYCARGRERKGASNASAQVQAGVQVASLPQVS